MELLFPIEAPVARGLLLILGPVKSEGLRGGEERQHTAALSQEQTEEDGHSFTASLLPFSPCLGEGAEERLNYFTPPYSSHCAVCLVSPPNMWVTLTWSYLSWLQCQRISSFPTPDCNHNTKSEIPGVWRKIPLSRNRCHISETALKKSSLGMKFRCLISRTAPQIVCIFHSFHTTCWQTCFSHSGIISAQVHETLFCIRL